eukprot:TRINITY_DN10389_c0_g2_i1.p1 TRINITY_DN10389_c0_g2~~TRINITY_DN10389_c0_g2_i1.p1  ORF type:complete len:422 (-),score=90.06 TRINITY_DN10389_c0_g2_i1:112-1377(-)
MLSMFCNEFQKDWDTYIRYVLLSYLSAAQESTKVSPFYAVHGRHPRFPIEVQLRPSETRRVPVEQYLKELTARMAAVKEFIREHNSRAQHKQALNYDKGTRNSRLMVDDLVWLYCPPRSTTSEEGKLALKLMRPWQGPYRIVARMSPTTFRLRQEGERTRPLRQLINEARLKRFKERKLVPTEIPKLDEFDDFKWTEEADGVLISTEHFEALINLDKLLGLPPRTRDTTSPSITTTIPTTPSTLSFPARTTPIPSPPPPPARASLSKALAPKSPASTSSLSKTPALISPAPSALPPLPASAIQPAAPPAQFISIPPTPSPPLPTLRRSSRVQTNNQNNAVAHIGKITDNLAKVTLYMAATPGFSRADVVGKVVKVLDILHDVKLKKDIVQQLRGCDSVPAFVLELVSDCQEWFRDELSRTD